MKNSIALFVVISVLLFTNNIGAAAAEKSTILTDKEHPIVKEAQYDYSSVRRGNVYINGVPCEDLNFVITDEKIVWVPFLEVLEKLGASVKWYDTLWEFLINFQDKMYIGYFSTFVDNKTGEIDHRAINITERDSGYRIQMSNIAYDAFYTVLDNRMYMVEESFGFLLKHFGYEVNTDISSGVVEIKTTEK